MLFLFARLVAVCGNLWCCKSGKMLRTGRIASIIFKIKWFYSVETQQ